MNEFTGLTIKGLVNRAHRNAVKKGFWDQDNQWRELRHHIEQLMIKASPEYANYIGKLLDEHERAFHQALVGMRLMLMVTELAEGFEGFRKGDLENLAEELADVFIRGADFAGGEGIDLDQAITKKMAYNDTRPYKHGKWF